MDMLSQLVMWAAKAIGLWVILVGGTLFIYYGVRIASELMK